jgi:predicted nucleic acid-binding protein
MYGALSANCCRISTVTLYTQDDMVLELAVKAGCDGIVTYNQGDFAGVEETFQVRVVAPGAFLKDIGA